MNQRKIISRKKISGYRIFRAIVAFGFLCSIAAIFGYSLTPGGKSGEQSSAVSDLVAGSVGIAQSNATYVAVSSAELTADGVGELRVGDEFRVAIDVLPATAVVKNAVWSSSNEEVLTCENGNVKVLSKGEAVVSVSINGGEAVCEQSFTVALDRLPTAQTLDLSPLPSAVDAYGVLSLYALTDSAASQSEITWSVSGSGVLFEDSKVALKDVGSILVTATVGSLVESRTIQVVDGGVAAPTEMRFSSSALNGKTGARSNAYSLLTMDGSATNAAFWSSSNPAVCKVSKDGTVRFISAGSAVLTATSCVNPSLTAQIAVDVTDVLPTTISISGKNQVAKNKRLKLTAVFDVAPTDGGVTFTSSDTSVATVNSVTGVVSGVGYGKATIYAVSNADASVKTQITVSVVYPASFRLLIRKLIGHFLAFGVIGALGAFTYFLYIRRRAVGGVAAVASGFFIALISEVFQLPVFTEGRFFAWSDVAIDLCGYVLGMCALYLILALSYVVQRIALRVNERKRAIPRE